jgi:superoxide dismutase, Fe-Mn family
MKPLARDPAGVKGMSERLIVSHSENNHGGAVKRLNLMEEQLAGLDFAAAPGFVVHGLKHEQLVVMNSMILHEVFFDGLSEESEPGLRANRCSGPRLREPRALAPKEERHNARAPRCAQDR